MKIYVDETVRWGVIIGYHGKDAAQAARVGARNGHQWCHLFADKADCPELHVFARRIGLRREWFQGDHYDITPSRRQLAVRLGAQEVTKEEAVAVWRAQRSPKMPLPPLPKRSVFVTPSFNTGLSPLPAVKPKLPPLKPRLLGTSPAREISDESGLWMPKAVEEAIVEKMHPDSVLDEIDDALQSDISAPGEMSVDDIEVVAGDQVLTPDEYAKHKSSTKENYCTPASFLEVVTDLGPIGLDPCSNENALTCAKTEYRFDKGQDGLLLPWEGHGLVFCNPPYGRKTALWLRRMAEMGARGVEIVGLIAARPDTIEFQACTAPLICFWRGRMIFLDGDTGMPCTDKHGKPTAAIFPQAVLYWGPQLAKFRELFTYDKNRPKGQRGGKVMPWGAQYVLTSGLPAEEAPTCDECGFLTGQGHAPDCTLLRQ